MPDAQPAHAPTHADPAPDVVGAPDGRHGPAGRDAAGVPPARAAGAQRGLALAVALVLVAVGLAGWAVTGTTAWTGSGRTLAGLGVNPLHNVVHLALGAAGLLLWRRPGGVRGYGLLLAVLDGLVLVYGLAAAGTSWDVLGLNRASLVLHLVVTVVGLAVAAWPRPDRRRHRERRRSGRA